MTNYNGNKLVTLFSINKKDKTKNIKINFNENFLKFPNS